jgi:hypothetical protein
MRASSFKSRSFHIEACLQMVLNRPRELAVTSERRLRPALTPAPA